MDNSYLSKKRRKDEAQERQKLYNILTPEEKLRALTHRPGQCVKERKKLLKQIENSKGDKNA